MTYTPKQPISTLLSENSTFLSYIFLTLISQILVTISMVYIFRKYPNVTTSLHVWHWYLLILILLILLTVGILMIQSIPLKLVFFTILSCIFGILLSDVKVPRQVINAAIFGTLGIFITMFLAGTVITSYGYDLSWMSGILLVSLLGLIIGLIVCSMFEVNSTTHKVFIYLSLIIFSIFILFDTNVILNKKLKGDFVSGALSYYLDILNLFLSLIRVQQN
jgi:FtsH-binding integral membrane protein